MNAKPNTRDVRWQGIWRQEISRRDGVNVRQAGEQRQGAVRQESCIGQESSRRWQVELEAEGSAWERFRARGEAGVLSEEPSPEACGFPIGMLESALVLVESSRPPGRGHPPQVRWLDHRKGISVSGSVLPRLKAASGSISTLHNHQRKERFALESPMSPALTISWQYGSFFSMIEQDDQEVPYATSLGYGLSAYMFLVSNPEVAGPAAMGKVRKFRRIGAKLAEIDKRAEEKKQQAECNVAQDENPLKKLNPVQLLKQVDDFDTESVITYLTESGQRTTKKNKQALKKLFLHQKLQSAQEEKKKQKKIKKQQQLVGDLNPMKDALPDMELLQKMLDSKDQVPRVHSKPRVNLKAKKRQDLTLQGISTYHQILDFQPFKENPFQAIATHLKNKIDAEKMEQ
ncbi:FAM207A [Cordylochernes scorpioides]|uniref:FAM207A n=1 Tax=Cordylochernes scorpioides TaxID=51811 RepID=A0ABY6LRU7_9ARAC|nr:FAM207A [Cordylochernes scorpioides]